MKVINSFTDFENFFLENNRPFLIERELIISFSKEDLKNLIEITKEEYLKEKLPYINKYERDKIKYNYSELSELSKYFIDMINYYYAWWEELDISKKFLDKLENAYKLKFEARDNSKKYIDIETIPIRKVLELYNNLPDNLNRNIHCILKWHNDSSPSLKVYEHTNSFNCFWCWRWWNVINLVSEIEWISTKEAYKKLIQLFG